ncbi:hypothetical protein QVD17_01235 [Tagetes erecta]|uniref:EGF-like domain-containing protein n=1 Tax=Tagetes erecta TaxID=13708 RepID=A0AAD8LA84_TARER|nr:hypothetical protein QVD17_01235 [Tagetes erecta]
MLRSNTKRYVLIHHICESSQKYHFIYSIFIDNDILIKLGINIAMIFNRLLVQWLFLTLVFPSNSLNSQSKRGPGCSTTCGNVTIPYPFGIEENCYLDTSYMVTCNMTSGSVSIQGMNVSVVDISLNGHLRALSKVGSVCYNESGEHFVLEKSRTELSRFPLSLGQNELTTLGCDVQSTVKSKTDLVEVTCTTAPGRCMHTVSCSSNVNCCQTRIEHVLPTHFYFLFRSDQNKTGHKNYTSCAYAFIGETGRYNFSELDIYHSTSEKFRYEMLLDWTVGDTNCQEAQKNISSYLCKENSECFDVDYVKGYRCSCSTGYHGNPYLENGCQDVNECEGSENDCIHRCVNTNGSYKCSCPFGQHGDGKKKGMSCTYSKGFIISVSAASVMLSSLILYEGLKQRRIMKSRERFFKKNGGLILQKLLFESKRSSQTAKIFSARILEKATELLTGRKVYSHDGTESELGLAIYFVSSLERGCLIEVLDSKVKQDVVDGHIKKIAKLAKECVEIEGKNRPNMKRVKDELKEINESYLKSSLLFNKVKYIC